MGAVFVSYRRGDAEGQARALSLELVRLLGKDSLFMDVDSIALGRDFRQVLQEHLSSCDVMLALIGPGWIDAKDGSGKRRLESPTDFVRQEIAAALKRNIPVIPVLLQGAQIPPPERLPDDLKDLSYRNGFELGHTHMGVGRPRDDEAPRVRCIEHSRSVRITAEHHQHVTARSTGRTQFSLRRNRAAAVIALLVGAAALLMYGYQRIWNRGDPVAEITQSPQPSQSGQQTALPPTGVGGTTPLPTPSTVDGGLAASGLEFSWPGDDCWDIVRGTEVVTWQCGANKQALGAGRYTIKGRSAPVFIPFEVNIKSGTPTRVSLGGVFEFSWPGDDCWDIIRGTEPVTWQCGAKKQALGAGRYTIKGRSAPVFTPFTVDIKDGSLTHVVIGGVFQFAWPGDDCWDIVRGTEPVTWQCGAKKQALGAGRYTIKGRSAPVFKPFEIEIVNGAQLVKAP